MATDRVIVHKDIAPAFTAAIKEALKAAAQQPLTLVSAASKERVAKLVSDALASGAHLMGSPLEVEGAEGVRLNRVLLGDVKEDMAVWNDESFAPLAACMVVDSDDQAIAMANRSGYGLSAAVFTEDLRKGFALARRIESG